MTATRKPRAKESVPGGYDSPLMAGTSYDAEKQAAKNFEGTPFGHNDDTDVAVEAKSDAKVIEVLFTSVVDEIVVSDDGYGLPILHAFLHSVAEYGKNGEYSVSKHDINGAKPLEPGESERITVTVEGL